MKFKIHGEKDLGVLGCDVTVEGDTPAEVLTELLPHLRDEHDLDMPDADMLLSQFDRRHPLEGRWPKDVAKVIERLYSALDLPGSSDEALEMGRNLGSLPPRSQPRSPTDTPPKVPPR